MSTVRNTKLGGIVSDGLVLYLYAPNKISYPRYGSTWFDLSKLGNDGTINGPEFIEDDKVFINGFSFVNANNDYVDCGNDSSLQLQAITISAFVKFSSIENTTIGAKRFSSTSNMSYFLGQSPTAGKVRWGTSVNGTTQDALDTVKSDFTTDIIYAITVVYDHSQGRKEIWLNGVLENSGTTNGNLYNSTENALVGSDARIDFTMPGNIYLYKMYNRSLTPDEISQNFNVLKNKFNLKYFLDVYTNVSAAYSLRQLNSNINHVIQVRRDSDGLKRNFSASEIAGGTLEAWVGVGNNGYVTILYDQSLNDRHLEQTTDASQPMIVSGGTLLKINGKPTIYHDGVNDRLTTSNIPALDSKPMTIISVAQNPDAGTNARIFTQRDGSGTGVVYAINRDSTVCVNFDPSSGASTLWSDLSADSTASQRMQYIFVNDSDVGSYYKNGILQESKTANTSLISNSADLHTGYDSALTTYYELNLQEIIIFSDDKTSSRTNIENDVNGHYSIY